MTFKSLVATVLVSLTALTFSADATRDAARAEDLQRSVAVAIVLDHNPMLVDAEVQARDGTWRKARLWARVHRQTGIVQVDASIAGERHSLAIDIGASYSFVSGGLLQRLAGQHPAWPLVAGALGCANIWGLWPQEERWPVLRVPEIRLGATTVTGVGLVGLPNMFGDGADLAMWYSQKTAAPVVGFLGPNAFKGFRLEIDYADAAVYLERGAADDVHDIDLAGLTLHSRHAR
jgi:hypothetical protein